MAGKNTEVARSTCLFTHTALACIQYNTFPIEYQAKFDMAAFNINIKNMFNLFMYITISNRERWWWPIHVSCM